MMDRCELPEAVQRWFAKAEESGHECMDNYRAAKVSDPEQVKAYEEQRRNGCCGSCDVSIEDDDGNLWIVGFNYGH